MVRWRSGHWRGWVGLVGTVPGCLGPMGWWRWGLLGQPARRQDPLGRPGEGRWPRVGGASGPGAFLRIRLLAQAAAPPLTFCPASALAWSRNPSHLPCPVQVFVQRWEGTQPLPSGLASGLSSLTKPLYRPGNRYLQHQINTWQSLLYDPWPC